MPHHEYDEKLEYPPQLDDDWEARRNHHYIAAIERRRFYTADGGFEICTFEGQSGKLNESTGGYGWFDFEEDFASGCLELTKLGFTVQQIMEEVNG